MKRIAQFNKVSLKQFVDSYINEFGNKPNVIITELHEDICLPKRGTVGSAGYDFFAPFNFTLAPGQGIKIPTGVKVNIEEGWVLKCYPRSGMGSKYRLQLDNTVGIIDSDYYYSDNEGHVFVKLTNDSRTGKILKVKKGDAFMQGIFLEYGITYNDDVKAIRNGGFGSTDSKE